MRVEEWERLECAEAMRAALARSGLRQAAFATAVGTSTTRFAAYKAGNTIPSAVLFLRCQRIASGLEGSRELGLMSAPSTAEAILTALDAGDDDWAWRMLLQGRDHLQMMLRTDRQALASWEAAPSTTGRVEWDTLLAALTRDRFGASMLPYPGWTAKPPLPRPWLPEHPFLDQAHVIATTPDFLRRLNIFVPDRDLSTA